MSQLYLTETSISDLTTFIFAAYLVAYLWQLGTNIPKEHNPQATFWLARSIGGVSAYFLLSFLEHSLYPNLGFYVGPLNSIAITLGLVAWLQFAYYFPTPLSKETREAQYVLWLTLLLPLGEVYYTIRRYIWLAQGEIVYRSVWADYFLLLMGTMALITILRQLNSADLRKVFILKKIWHPKGEKACTSRTFLFLTLAPIGLFFVVILRNMVIISSLAMQVLLSVGTLLTLLALLVFYLNNLLIRTSFLAKLSAISLAIVLSILGAIGHFIAPSITNLYTPQSLIINHQSLRFTPNSKGGYDISQIPFYFEKEYDEKLGEIYNSFDLAFDFPFFDQVWSNAYITSDGAISFGSSLNIQQIQFYYGEAPTILVFERDSIDPAALPENDYFLLKNSSEKIAVTWNQIPLQNYPKNTYTTQLVLYPDGVFDINIEEIPKTFRFSPTSPWASPWLLGALPGNRNLKPQYINFSSDLPIQSGEQGVIENYHLDFRRAIHQPYKMIAWLVLLSTLLTITVSPLILRQNIIAPLENLITGMRKVETGDLSVQIPVKYQDEFGYLTQMFNKVIAESQSLFTELESRVTERTQELTKSQKETQRTKVLLETVLNNLDIFIYVGDMQTGQILFANQPMLEVFGDIHGKICWQVLYSNQRSACKFCTNSLLVGKNGRPTEVHQQEIQDPLTGRWYANTSSAIEWTDGSIVRLATRTDITETKEAERLLLTHKQEVVREKERRRLARDLHDTLTQSLHSLVLMADTSQHLLRKKRYADLPNSMQLLEDSARQSLREMRLLLHELQLSEDEQINLEEALGTRLSIVEQRIGIKTKLSVTGEKHLSKLLRKEIFYIVIEALNNSIKHADTNQIFISIHSTSTHVDVLIKDNGRGFDTKPLPSKGMGFENMRYRAKKLNGTLKIESRVSKGTAVQLRVEF